MKKLLALLAMTIALAACSAPSEVSLPDSNIKYENKTVMYKDKPYTGKITTNLKEKVQGYEGFINLKEGHLDGLTEVTGKNGSKFKVTVVNGKFDGDYIAEEGPAKVHLVFAAGKLKSAKIEVPNVKQDMTVGANGNISGKITMGGKTVALKDGVAEMNGMTMKMRMHDNGKMLTENYQKDKLMQKEESDVELTPAALEEKVFPAVLSGQ